MWFAWAVGAATGAVDGPPSVIVTSVVTTTISVTVTVPSSRFSIMGCAMARDSRALSARGADGFILQKWARYRDMVSRLVN